MFSAHHKKNISLSHEKFKSSPGRNNTSPPGTQETWVCEVCTFINKSKASSDSFQPCNMCGMLRGMAPGTKAIDDGIPPKKNYQTLAWFKL